LCTLAPFDTDRKDLRGLEPLISSITWIARPLRIEYPGALYHVTTRGNARQDIYLVDKDRSRIEKAFGPASGTSSIWARMRLWRKCKRW
jgi:hypothetical protein